MTAVTGAGLRLLDMALGDGIIVSLAIGLLGFGSCGRLDSGSLGEELSMTVM